MGETAPLTESVPVFVTPSPLIRRVAIDSPWTWLAAGWNDLFYAREISFGFGLAVAAGGVALVLGLAAADLLVLVLPLAAGFFLVAPALAVGLYEVGRRRDRNEPVAWRDVLFAFRRNGAQIALMGLTLMFINLVWVRIATLLFALFFNDVAPNLGRLVMALFFSPLSLPFLLVGGAIGAVLAAFTFAISVIAIPMLLDREVSVFTAIATSWTAARVNWRPLALWAVLIVAFTGMGLATFFIGLVIAAPLIAHASWRAYKALVI